MISVLELLILPGVVVGFLAFLVGVVWLLKYPKTRLWGLALLVAPLGIELLFFGFVFLQKGHSVGAVHSTAVTERPMPMGDRRPEYINPVPANATSEPRQIQTEPRPLGSGPSENTSKKETKKPLPDGRGSEDRGSDKDKLGKSNKRPDWVDTPAGVVDNAYQCCVTVGPYTTSIECARAMPDALRPVVTDYVKMLLGPKVANARVVEKVIQANIMGQATKGIWEEKIKSSVGLMTQQHVLLVFDHKINDLIRQKLHESYVEQRIIWSSVVLGGILVSLVIAFVLLKTDIMTKGKYRRYVLSGAGTVGLGVLYAMILAAAPSHLHGDIAVPVTLIGGGAGGGLTISKKYRHLGVAILAAIVLGDLILLVD